MSASKNIASFVTAAAVIVFSYPLLNEGTANCSPLEQCFCSAVEKKVVRSVASTDHPGGTLFLGLMQQMSNGVYATNVVRQKHPNLPPFVGCTLVYWDMTLNPEGLQQAIQPSSEGRNNQSQSVVNPRPSPPPPVIEPRRTPPQPSPQRDQTRWGRYCNGRFGQCVDIPDSYQSDPLPANGDGLVFRDGRGMTVTLSGIRNVLHASLKGELEEQMKRLPRIVYKDSGANWFVLSGYDGDNIYYVKEYVSANFISTLWVTYPARNKNDYEAVVARLSTSFSPVSER